ncbi:hypothetical protein E2C01_001772 [Portunus trituberculatus]|uniref:Uncharacterized protein n=1 Tax=Portunus trituberculatus TaxID=210409 RepID=A0A5B7CIG1_PORTR|nr:hypothetical protein [Portunus trituberculatus]
MNMEWKRVMVLKGLKAHKHPCNKFHFFPITTLFISLISTPIRRCSPEVYTQIS